MTTRALFEPAMLRLCRRLSGGATVCRAPVRTSAGSLASATRGLRGFHGRRRITGRAAGQRRDTISVRSQAGRASVLSAVVREDDARWRDDIERFRTELLMPGLEGVSARREVRDAEDAIGASDGLEWIA